MRGTLTLLLTLATFLGSANESEVVLRTWRSADGKFSVKATFVSGNADKVTLRKATGNTVTVSLDQLSESDRRYVAQQRVNASRISLGIKFVTTDQARKALKNDERSAYAKTLPKVGLLVLKAVPEGGFAKAGGKAGDVILTIDGNFVGRTQPFMEWVAEAEVGETYLFVVRRMDEKAGKWNRKSFRMEAQAKSANSQVARPTGLFTFDVAGGQLAVSVSSPVVYIPANAPKTHYQFIYHAFRDSGGDVQRDKVGFYAVEGQPTEIHFSSDNEELLGVHKHDSLGIVLTFKKEGTGNVKVDFADKTFLVPFKIVKLNINEGDKGAEVVRGFGLPDGEESVFVSWPNTKSFDDIIYSPNARQSSISAKHWRYKKHPHLVISIVDGKVYRIRQ